jgi:phosphoglycolate phosphatase-like HAD superfamily hydrolase
MARGLAVFDIDGTLTATNEVDDECFLRAVRDVLSLDVAPDWSDAPHVTDSALAPWICEQYGGRSLRDGEVAAILGRFIGHLEVALAQEPQRFAPIAGASDVFARLRTHGWDSAMATGGWDESARLKLRAVGIDPDKTPLATSSDAHTRIEILHLAVQRAATSHTRIVSIGDGVWDLDAARTLGWPFIGIGTGARAERLREAGARVVIPDLRDTAGLVQALETTSS